jgi:hypothetical protein
MWRDGFTIQLVAWGLNALALAFCAGLGARALIDPNWAARFVRLRADDQGGGFAEFRATYGGLFLASHAAGLYFTMKWIFGGEQVVGIFAAGAAAALAGAWAGAAAGRALALVRDASLRTRFNQLSIGVESALALTIAAPWIVWALSGRN